MATFHAYQAFDMSQLDLSSLVTDGTDQGFQDNINTTVNGVTYQDVAGFEYYDGGYHSVYFGGTGFTITSNGVPTGGTVTGIAEIDGPLGPISVNNPNAPAHYLLQGISVGVTALVAAAQTLSTSDDLTLLKTVLAGADTFYLSAGADLAKAFDGADTLYGYAGADVLYGGNGADKLYGGVGNDTLWGEAGMDKLFGGAGHDVLVGGDGADSFVFNTAATATSSDIIKDFSHAQGDHIDLSAAILRGIGQSAGATLAADAFYAASGATTAHDASDRVIYNTATGKLYYDADGTGTAYAPVLLATLGSALHPTLVAGDFHIVV